MKRKALIVLLSLGTIGGFAAGCASMCKHRSSHHRSWRTEVTNICANAIKQAQSSDAKNEK